MKKPVLLISVVLFGAILLVLAQCGAIGFTYEWHQKITVTVEGPDGPISGSSVQLMFAKPVMLVNSSNTHAPGLHGEAVIVELPQKRYLFALLPNAWNISRHSAALYGKELEAFGASKVADNALLASWNMGWVSKMSKLAGLPAKPIAEKYYPLLVTFDEINDPASVKRVDPNNLAASFGPGFALKSITLEITDEPVTEGKVESVLGWWCEYRKKRARLNGSTSIAISDNELSNTLGTGAFRIGDCS